METADLVTFTEEILIKNFTLDVWLGSRYVSAYDMI